MNHFSKFTALVGLAGLILCGCTSASGSQPEQTDQTVQNKPDSSSESSPEQAEQTRTLVAYFSATGNTKEAAKTLAETVNADLYEIVPEVSYSDEDLNYTNDASRANKEQNDPSSRPAIASDPIDAAKYDVIFLGYPIWHGIPPRIIETFLEDNDLNGKIIIPFCTSGGSPFSDGELEGLEEDADWKEGKRLNKDSSAEEISKWVDTLDLPE